jgi:photosystem II stability/assembly factor-like uncharacterized protein
MTSSQKGGWELFDSGVTQDINSIFFICLNRGTMVGDEGVILRTGDGGATWAIQDSGVTENLYDVFYFGYSITVAFGASGTILYTNNSGMNWTIIQTGMMGTYYGGQMMTDTVGVAVGVNAIFQPFFTKTNDGWQTWESTSFYIEHDEVSYEGWLSDVYFMNESVGFATAVVDAPAGGAIVRTTDGGNNWETVYFSDTELFDIDFTYEGIGYAVGSQGVILQTLDGGDTWNNVESGVNDTLQSIDFSTETKGTAVGNNGVIIRTENEGASWTQQTSGTTLNLLGVQFISDRIGFIVGENGLLLRTTTGGYPDDFFPPETNCTLSGTLQGDIYVSDVEVSFSATDNISGVASTTYKLDDGLWTTYTDSFLVSTEGNHTLYYYSIDNAGNAEEEKTCEFTIQYPPEINITITGGFGISATIKNRGTMDLTNVSWDLSLDGGIILFGKQRSGFADIKAGGVVILKSLVFGVGKTTITLSIASTEKTVQGRVFLFFVRI